MINNAKLRKIGVQTIIARLKNSEALPITQAYIDNALHAGLTAPPVQATIHDISNSFPTVQSRSVLDKEKPDTINSENAPLVVALPK